MERRSFLWFQKMAMSLFVFLSALFVLHLTSGVSYASKTAGVANLNTATVEQLAIVPHIGPKKAEAIVKFREEHGDFKAVDDVKNVKGIGGKLLEKIKDHLTVEGETTIQKAEKAEKAGKKGKKEKKKE
jgi:competence protein ComEA